MAPYIGKKFHGECCGWGCCFHAAKCQPHYRKPNSDEKRMSRKIARARLKREIASL